MIKIIFLTILSNFFGLSLDAVKGDEVPVASHIAREQQYADGNCRVKLDMLQAQKKIVVDEIGCTFFSLSDVQTVIFSQHLAKFKSVRSLNIDLARAEGQVEIFAVTIEGKVERPDGPNDSNRITELWAGFRSDGVTLILWKDISPVPSNFTGTDYDKYGKVTGVWRRKELGAVSDN